MHFYDRGGQWAHIEGQWDLLIAHPPCTYLTVSGNAWFNTERYGKKAEKRWKDRVEGAVFFMRFVAADCKRIAIENPIGIMGTSYRKADQIIQPYQFGHHAMKTTCLWLKNLPKLTPTDIVDPGNFKKQKQGAEENTMSVLHQVLPEMKMERSLDGMTREQQKREAKPITESHRQWLTNGDS